MAKITGKIEVTASTKINKNGKEEMVSKTMFFDYPVFDEALDGLKEYKHGAKEVFLTCLAADTIELQAVVRRAIEKDHGIVKGERSKSNKNLKNLGL